MFTENAQLAGPGMLTCKANHETLEDPNWAG